MPDVGEVINPGMPQANAGTAIDLCYCWQEKNLHETEDRILHPLPGQNVRIAHGTVVATFICRIPECMVGPSMWLGQLCSLRERCSKAADFR